MPDQENWISLPQAVAMVKLSTGVSQGPAQQKLIAICATGDVRSRWTAHYSKTRPPIHKRDWIGADIDWANFRVVKADGAGMAGVDFSRDDLDHWAASRKSPAAEPSFPLRKEEAATPKRHRRYPLDDGLAAEGAAGILSSPPKWANANKAAVALAPQTDGPDSAKIDRLGRKISKLLETSRNSSKD